MLIDTKYNVGDKVWGVRQHWYRREVECPSCHGEGGANIPGTGVFVRCQDCKGSGARKREVHEYSATEQVIDSIDVEVKRHWLASVKDIVVNYRYNFIDYIHANTFGAVAENREEAIVEAKRLAEEDEFGEFEEAR